MHIITFVFFIFAKDITTKCVIIEMSHLTVMLHILLVYGTAMYAISVDHLYGNNVSSLIFLMMCISVVLYTVSADIVIFFCEIRSNRPSSDEHIPVGNIPQDVTEVTGSGCQSLGQRHRRRQERHQQNSQGSRVLLQI